MSIRFSVARAAALFLAVIATDAAAEGEGKSPSIMFEQGGAKDDRFNSDREARETALGERCMEMTRQLEALKGNPQRRYALMQEYRAECEERP